MRRLGEVSGARLSLSDPAGGEVRVSASVERQPLRQGIEAILAGFSYAIYPEDGSGRLAVRVLSTAKVERRGHGSGRVIAELPASGAGTGATPDRAAALLEGSSADEPEAVLSQEIADNDGNRQQALDQITGRNDPRATAALIQAAALGTDKRAGAQATEALWHHAADLQFADETTVSALEQLTNDADAEVQKTARQALVDMQRYRRHASVY